MSHSQDELGTHWAQALSYLHRQHLHLKIWAALFIGERGGGPGSGPPGLPRLSTPTLTLTHPPLWLERGFRWQARRGASEGVSGVSVLRAGPFCVLALSPAVPHTGGLLPYAREGERERGKGGEVWEPPPTGRRAPRLSRRLYHLLLPPGRVPDGQ